MWFQCRQPLWLCGSASAGFDMRVAVMLGDLGNDLIDSIGVEMQHAQNSRMGSDFWCSFAGISSPAAEWSCTPVSPQTLTAS